MAYITIKIPINYRILLYFILFLSWTSGVVFYILNNYISIEGEFGPEKHPWQFSVLMLHGAAAFAMMIFYGSLLTSHIPSGWKSKRLKKLGTVMIVCLAIQAISAYLLYYMSHEQWRLIVANTHAFIGFCFPGFLIAHILMGIKHRNRIKKSES